MTMKTWRRFHEQYMTYRSLAGHRPDHPRTLRPSAPLPDPLDEVATRINIALLDGLQLYLGRLDPPYAEYLG